MLRNIDIGQIQIYINYIDMNIKKDYMNKTVGVIVCKKDNRLVAEYTSDKSIFEITYQLIE